MPQLSAGPEASRSAQESPGHFPPAPRRPWGGAGALESAPRPLAAELKRLGPFFLAKSLQGIAPATIERRCGRCDAFMDLWWPHTEAGSHRGKVAKSTLTTAVQLTIFKSANVLGALQGPLGTRDPALCQV